MLLNPTGFPTALPYPLLTGAFVIKTCKLLMLTKKLIVPKAVTVHKSLVFVLNTVPLGGRSKGASSQYLFFFFSFSILGRNIPGKLDRNAFSFPKCS